jgi:hypothetical protein
VFVAAILLPLTAGSASASCVFTPAICQAICGKDCCDATNLTTPTNPEALSKISVKSLKAELKQAKSGTNFQKMLSREVSRRGG